MLAVSFRNNTDFVKILLDELLTKLVYLLLEVLEYAGLLLLAVWCICLILTTVRAVARGLFRQTDGAAVIQLTDCQQGSEIVCKFISGQPTDELLANLDNILATCHKSSSTSLTIRLFLGQLARTVVNTQEGSDARLPSS